MVVVTVCRSETVTRSFLELLLFSWIILETKNSRRENDVDLVDASAIDSISWSEYTIVYSTNKKMKYKGWGKRERERGLVVVVVGEKEGEKMLLFQEKEGLILMQRQSWHIQTDPSKRTNKSAHFTTPRPKCKRFVYEFLQYFIAYFRNPRCVQLDGINANGFP